MTIDKLVQRGLESFSNDLGSKTPIHIRVMRISRELGARMTTKQALQESYKCAVDFGDEEKIKEIKELAEELSVNLT